MKPREWTRWAVIGMDMDDGEGEALCRVIEPIADWDGETEARAWEKLGKFRAAQVVVRELKPGRVR